MRRFQIFAVALSIVPALCYGQRGAGMGHAVAAPAAAPHVAVHAAAPASGHTGPAPYAAGGAQGVSGHYVRTRSGAIAFRPTARTTVAPVHTNGSRRLLSQDVPGLGFDYPHLGAVGGGRGHRFFPDRDRDRPFLAYFPFFGGGYYMPLYPDEGDEGAPVTDESADYAGPDYSEDYPAPPRPGDTAQGFPAAPPATAEAKIGPTPDEYVFVRRDGTLFFAVAYTWDKGNLRYITNQGLRRSASGETLDLNATQQFNEQRGLIFHPPAA